MGKNEGVLQTADKDRQIYELWKLIDDIDTATDMFKGDYEGFTKNTIRRIKQRFEIVPTAQLDELYDKFYKETP